MVPSREYLARIVISSTARNLAVRRSYRISPGVYPARRGGRDDNSKVGHDTGVTLFLPVVMLLACCLLMYSQEASFAQAEPTPLQFLKEQERKNRDQKGEVYLGKVMTLVYPAYTAETQQSYHPLLLELTDVLKTPLRENYRLVLMGYSDSSGSTEDNLRLSKRRADILKKTLIRKYYFSQSRIAAEGLGAKDPEAPNETPEGRALNRRVEIHVYGNVSEAVRFIDS